MEDERETNIVGELKRIFEHTKDTCETKQEQICGILSDLSSNKITQPIINNPFVSMLLLQAKTTNNINSMIDGIFGCPEIPSDLQKKVYGKNLTIDEIFKILDETNTDTKE